MIIFHTKGTSLVNLGGNHHLSKNDRSQYYQAILQNPSLLQDLRLDEKDLYKHTLLEPLSFDMEQYIKDNEN